MYMIIVNRTENQITGMVNGKPYSRNFSEEAYDFMKQLEAKANKAETMEELRKIVEEFEPYTRESYKEMVETISPNIFVDPKKNTFHLKVGDKIGKEPLPEVFAQKIIKSVEKGIDVTPLIKCFARYMRQIPGRPAYSMERAKSFAHYISAPYMDQKRADQLVEEQGLSMKVAQEKATGPQVAITQEGLLVCFKVSREVMTKYALDENEKVVTKSRYAPTVDEDTGLITYATPEHVEYRVFEPAVMGARGDEFWCVGGGYNKKGHHIRVGCTHFLENWDQVSTPGCKGLHCGGLSYIRGYQVEGTETHNIFVDPADIHTINESSDGVMTVKRYFVHSSFAGPNRGIYHSSTYAELNDAEYQKLLSEAIESMNQKHKDAVDGLEATI
jgi:hypothetical protein